MFVYVRSKKVDGIDGDARTLASSSSSSSSLGCLGSKRLLLVSLVEEIQFWICLPALAILLFLSLFLNQLAIMCFTLVMEKEVIVAIGGIIANLAKIFKLAVVHNFRPLVYVLFTLEMSDEFVTYFVIIRAYVANAERFLITCVVVTQ